ncbi:MAG: MarR family transcriptional regulator [Ectothiorhodospiraceae bacterium]|nr:MarR family transcriptional regulator [Ectothiorhodospiraceae bacterium]
MQLDLLSETPASRRTDPESSHAAAEHVTAVGLRARQQRLVMRGFVRFPGMTTRELAARMNVCRYVVARRASELVPGYLEQGPQRRCTVTGRLAITWRPTPAAQRVTGKGKAA